MCIRDSTATATEKLPSKSAFLAFPHFEAGLTVANTAKQMGRAESTTYGYLFEYIRHKNIVDYTQWVDEEVGKKVAEAVKTLGFGPLKPIYVALNEEVDYNEIRIVQACLQNAEPVTTVAQ